jgi:SMC interacting uncharacterized protein involved in chromosome segregation
MSNQKIQDKKTELTREQLLELQVMNQKAGKLSAQLEMIGQRKQALMMELNILPDREKMVQTQRDEVVKQLQEAYSAAKQLAQIPDGMELNIETGEPLNPQKQVQ